jgi:uncharacterized protein (TIGR02757 family)
LKKSGKNSINNLSSVRALLDHRADLYNQPDFIAQDPIAIPRSYTALQDIEITGFWTATLSWGQRKTILNKTRELFALMDGAPHDFILNHREKDRKRFLKFCHRTFQATDTLYFLDFFQRYYCSHHSLEDAFLHNHGNEFTMREALHNFHGFFFDHENAPLRTRKHVSDPHRDSACKRLNMFLRWMVRRDTKGVDFGLWTRIDPSALMIPLDVHVQRVATALGILSANAKGWKAVEELTAVLRTFDASDPVRYDFALFGMGVLEQ